MSHQMRLTLHRIAVVGAMTGVSLIGSAPVEAQSLQGHVEQNAAPSEVFSSQSPQGPSEQFNSQGPGQVFIDPQACAEDNARLANKSHLPPGWGPPQVVAGNSIYNYPSEYWAYYQNYACRPGFAIVYRNLNYGKRPPPGQSGFYPGYGANTFNPYNLTPPPAIPGGVNFCKSQCLALSPMPAGSKTAAKG